VARLRQILLSVIGSVLLAAIAFGVFSILKSLFSNASAAGPTIAASAAIAVFAAGEYFTRQRIAQQYRWDKVSGTYAKFLHLIRRLGSDEPPEDLEEFMAQFNDDLLLWGSPKVITAWIEMVRASDRGLASNTEATELQRDLIRAIRKDLGQSDRRLDDHDLMHLLIHDIDDHFDSGLAPKQAATGNRSVSEAVYGSGKSS
jgi:hypothetical protein